ncbi:acyltransferase [Desulforamulus aquiferis]|uniref:Acyltransferase n=1 Tax=Desulforamulus aquiferis TaxID=1397668 RepID=A0AAW7ZEJ1_9FIRM|nr:acyltransferase [Desulforamulus aquiferis]MDO7787940.1 acyltransferase [Desulforamulus aquiferis]
MRGHTNGVRDKVAELDLLRAIAAISVIIIHITATPLMLGIQGSPYHLAVTLANQFARFSIPAFVFVTGFVLFYNYRDYHSVNWSAYFRKRITYVLVPYFLWSLLYFLFKQYISFREINLTEAWMPFLKALLMGESFYHLYFVVLIFQFYLLFPLVLPLWQRVEKHAGLVTLVIFGLYLAWVAMLFYNIRPWSSPLISFLFKYQGKLFLTWLGFFVLGAYCAGRLSTVRAFLLRWTNWFVLGACALLVAMVAEFYGRIAQPGVIISYAATSIRPLGILFTVVTIMAIIAVALKYLPGSSPLTRFTGKVSGQSYGIYLIHPLVLTFLEVFEGRLGLGYHWWVVLFNLLLCCMISYLGAYLLSRNSWTRHLIGR